MLSSGTKLGTYEVTSQIGAGGMGEVYQAHDIKLGRDVAIKVLPEQFARDPERLARFQREAKMLAALNHPNIAAIYGLEQSGNTHYLVMELVPGETLRERIAREGALPVKEALAIGRQIAEALEAAHESEKEIVHRDLKPANVKITPEGRVKVLDFGLAKAFAAEAVTDDPSNAPTLSALPTQQGVIMGTAAYMSPEQARGRTVTKATDVWAFGAVLYELLTARKAFRGETLPDTLASVIEREPDWGALPAAIPARIQDLLRRCLQKDPQRRLRDLGDARIDIEEALAALAAPTEPPRRRQVMIAFGVGGVIVLALAASLSRLSFLKPDRRGPATPAEYVQLTDFNDSSLAPALSPDGRMLTFVRGGAFGASAPGSQVYVKILPKGEPVQLTRDEFRKAQPAFSPDGSRIVYTALTNGFKWDSWQVPVLGGSPQPFLPNASGLVWIDDRQMLYSVIKDGVHMGIATSTENQSGQRDIYVPPGEGSMAHRSAISPDHKWALVVEMDGTGWLPCRLLPFDGLSSGRRVGPQEGQCTTAAWSPDGRWMYFSSSAGGGFHIWRQRYPDGAPEQITFGPTEQRGDRGDPRRQVLDHQYGPPTGSRLVARL